MASGQALARAPAEVAEDEDVEAPEFEPSQLTVAAAADESGLARLSVHVDDDLEVCPPCDLVAVVDISASMAQSCAGVTDGRT